MPAERPDTLSSFAVGTATPLPSALPGTASAAVFGERYGLEFVPHDRDYWLFNNSNHAVKEWLEAAGYEVSGTAIFAKWRQAAPTLARERLVSTPVRARGRKSRFFE